MLLSVVTQGKNDDYCGNFKQRLSHCVNKIIDNIQKLGIEDKVEIIIVDWGSEPIRLSEELKLIENNIVNFLYVPHTITSQIQGFSIPHTQNAGSRRAQGKYLMLLEGDSYIDIESFQKVINLLESDDSPKFYWGSRYQIPYDIHSNVNSIEELDKIISDVWSSKKCLPPHRGCPYNCSIWVHSKINPSQFGGGATCLLISKEYYDDCTGQYEILTKWGWSDIELHRRLCSKVHFNGDLEDLQIYFFTQEHYGVTWGGAIHGQNPSYTARSYRANDDNWGLLNYELELYKK